MDSDVLLIVKAIEGLQSNYVTNYILPIGTVLISGLLGGGVAYYSLHNQEKNKIEIQKIDSINNTIISVIEIRTRLISIKENYIGKITNEPIQRVLNIPSLLLNETKIDVNLGRLSFLAPNKKATEIQKWESITLISTLFSNYNLLQNILVKRNEMILDLFSKLEKYMGIPLDLKKLEDTLGKGTILKLIDLTELSLMLVDELIIETSDFLIEFHKIAKTKIDPTVLRKYGTILQIILPESNKDFIAKTPEVDLDLLSQILGRPVDELTKKYRPIYTK
ncbi:MAG: hypothetical protein OCC45_15445 [Desulfotalea sp.]